MTTIPIGIFVLALGVGAFLTARILPELERGRVGTLALAVVCVLVGMTFASVALHVYEIIRELGTSGTIAGSNENADIVAGGLETMLRDGGPLIGLAAAVYLLAPAGDEEQAPPATSAQTGGP